MQKLLLVLARTRATSLITEAKAKSLRSLFFVCLMVLVSVSAIISIYAGNASAAPNTNINFQARLLSNTGALVSDGFYTVEFKVYPQVSGGTQSWAETQVLTVKNGYLTASLGSVTPFGGGIDWSQEQWLSMNVNGDGEMSPRMKITAVPYAFRSSQADNLTTSGGTVTGDDLAQLAPGSVQSKNSSNSLLRLNQTGSGGLLQLQANGIDILTLSNAGDLTTARGVKVGSSSSTVAGTIRWTGTDFEGYDGSQWVSLTGGGGGGGGGSTSVKSVIKPADQIVNNSVAFVNDTDLKFAIESSEQWTFRFVLQANSGVTPDFKFAVTAPAGATCDVSVIDAEGATTISNLGCGVSSGLVAGNGANDTYEIVGTVINGATPGTVQLQWSQNTANASNSTVYAGSFLNAMPVVGGSATPSNAFVQGGNDFGATALLGTTASNDLVLVTNGTARLTVDSAGDVTINNDLSVSGNLTADLDTLLKGNITLGDASGDSLTINSSSVTISNGLIFDSGTFAIDSTNDFIGINNVSPANRLSINTPSTNDSSAEVLVYSGGASNKALVLQAVSGQTANLLEVQNNNGVSLFAVSASGSLILGNDTASPTAGQLVLNDSTASNGFTGVLGISALTSNRSINLPDASGTVCLSGNSGCGFVALAPGSAQTDSTTNNSLFVNKTGASGNLVLLQKNGTDVFTVGNNGQLTLRLNATSALSVLNSSGIPVLTVDTNTGAVRIGNTTADGVGSLLVLDTKNTAGDPTGENGGMYYNSSSNKFRCFENSTWRDCIYEPFVRSFVDSTADPAVDANTTNYWDTSAENNNSYPNITPTASSKAIMATVTLEMTSTTNQDVEITARVERGIGSVPTCGSGTPVGGQPGVFATNTGAIKTSTTTIIDSPNTTSPVYYVVCSDSATVGTGANITRLRVTLQEVNNQN